MPGDDSSLRSAHYAVGPDESCGKNIGEKGPDRAPTAQNTHTERLKRGKIAFDTRGTPIISQRRSIVDDLGVISLAERFRKHRTRCPN